MAPHRSTCRRRRLGGRRKDEVVADDGAGSRQAGIERMLRVVEAIPTGQVLTFGDVAALAEYGGPRTAGQVMAHHGGGVPWHRVVDASGRPPARHAVQALSLLRRDGVSLRPDGLRVDLARCRWVPTEDERVALEVSLGSVRD
jgi:alkylated DNA nucleotide flippase Atl1